MNTRLQELGLKLLATLHLSVPERREVPTAGVPLSALVAGMSRRLEATGWFPDPPPGDGADWTGARIERRGAQLWIHARGEIGVGRLGPVRSQPAASIDDAVRAYVCAVAGSAVDRIDGVRIDWTS